MLNKKWNHAIRLEWKLSLKKKTIDVKEFSCPILINLAWHVVLTSETFLMSLWKFFALAFIFSLCFFHFYMLLLAAFIAFDKNAFCIKIKWYKIIKISSWIFKSAINVWRCVYIFQVLFEMFYSSIDNLQYSDSKFGSKGKLCSNN